MNAPLKGKIAVVTGSGNGIGRACAMRFAQEGADVAILDIEQDALNEVADSLKQFGNRVLPIHLDLTQRPLVVDAFAKFLFFRAGGVGLRDRRVAHAHHHVLTASRADHA